MAKKRKAAFFVQAGTWGKATFIELKQYTLGLSENQPLLMVWDNKGKTRRRIKALIVWMACWELLPAALAVLLLGGLRND